MNLDAAALVSVADALATGQSVADETLVDLVSSTDILSLGMLADDLRRQRRGTAVTFLRVGDVGLPASPETAAWPPAAREVRVAVQAERLDAEARVLEAVVRDAGDVPVSACSLADLEAFAARSGRRVADLLRTLASTGVAAVADVPVDRLAHPEASWEALRGSGLIASRVTVSTNADAAGRIALLRRVAHLQRRFGGMTGFAPLARAWNPAMPSTGYEDVRFVAIARLCLRDVPSIQVDWALYGPKLAQVALTFGADDVDGVTASDDAPDGRRRAPLEEVLRNIRAAGFTPAERDGRFARVAA